LFWRTCKCMDLMDVMHGLWQELSLQWFARNAENCN
jgi:hypothetical protein